VVDALHAAQAQLTSPNETINLLPAYDQVERSPEHSAQLIGSYAGPLNVPFEGEGWFPAPEGSNSFGRRYAAFCDMIQQSRDSLKAKRRTKAWVLRCLEEICESKKCCQLNNPSQAPNGFDPAAWAAVLKLSTFLTATYANVASVFNDFDHDASGAIDVHEFRSLMKRIGADMSNEEVDTVCRHFDLNGDGRVQYQELISCFSVPDLLEAASFPDIVIQWLASKYGMKGLVDQYAWDLLCNVECFRHGHKLVDLLGDFLEQLLDVEDLSFFLFARSLIPHGIAYEFSSRREMGSSPAKSLNSDVLDRHTVRSSKYLPYEMVPGELELQDKALGGTPKQAEPPGAGGMSAAVCISICKRLVAAYPCLGIDDFLEFIDTAFEANGGQLDMEAPLIDVSSFIHFAVHRYHTSKVAEDLVSCSPQPCRRDVPAAPVDATIARNEISCAVTALRREVEKRVKQIKNIKGQMETLMESQPQRISVVEEQIRADEYTTLECKLVALKDEVATRLRMLSTLGTPESELEALENDKFCDYIRERSVHC